MESDFLEIFTRYPMPYDVVRRIYGEPGRDNAELARADMLVWLSIQPNISQGGQSYSYSSEDRKAMRAEARAIYKKYNDPKLDTLRESEVDYGYKGEWL